MFINITVFFLYVVGMSKYDSDKYECIKLCGAFMCMLFLFSFLIWLFAPLFSPK